VPLSRRALLLAVNAALLPQMPALSMPMDTRTPYTHRFRSHLIEISDTRLEVLEAGSGTATFVCSHPYVDAHAPFPNGGLTEALAGIGRTFYVCPRGTAGSASETRPSKLTFSQLVDDIEAVRQKLGIRNWVAVGSSTGGMTALQYGLRYPDSARGLILNCTAASYHFVDSPSSFYNPANPVFQQLERLRKTGSSVDYARAKLAASLHNGGVIDLVLQNATIQDQRAAVDVDEIVIKKWDVEAALPNIAVPTLIIAGRFDAGVGTLEPSMRILKAIKTAEYAVMNGSGHYPYDEEPARFKQVVTEFSQRHFGRDGAVTG
jgi:proline iminopeptidase